MKLPFTFDLKTFSARFMQHRGVIIGIYILCLVPTFFVVLSIFHKKNQFEEMKGEIECLALKMERVKELQKDRNAFINSFSEIDHYYVDHSVESLQFLSPETEALHLVMNNPAFETCDNIKQRHATLTKGGNRFIFAEGKRKVIDQIEEIELTQKRPVELNGHDLKVVLAAIEGVQIGDIKIPSGRPQFIMKQFHLNKKKLAERETYQLEMRLIKRGKIL